jgi:hypothetical protein
MVKVLSNFIIWVWVCGNPVPFTITFYPPAGLKEVPSDPSLFKTLTDVTAIVITSVLGVAWGMTPSVVLKIGS